MAVSKRLRYEVLRRDNHACRYCGATAPTVKLNADHVIPQSLGGADKPENLVTACTDCNAGKTSSMPNAARVADVDQDAFRQSDAEVQASGPTPREIRAAFHAHLMGVWLWAWKRGHSDDPIESEQQEAFRQLSMLADGSDLSAEQLTEIAFNAGSDRCAEAARFVDPKVTDEQDSLGVEAVIEWQSAWGSSGNGAGPTKDETAEFCGNLHALVLIVDAVAQRSRVLQAARRAGELRSTEISLRLSTPAARP